MKFNKVPADTFQKIQLGAGFICESFDPMSLESAVPIAATGGGTAFEAVPTFKDLAEGIDNLPANTKEAKRLDYWEVKLTGSFMSVDEAVLGLIVGAGDLGSKKITPRNDIKIEDFKELWWVGDYGDKGGYIAIKLINALSTGGFKTQSVDKDKGAFAFEFMGHYSIEHPETVPFEIYIDASPAA